MKTRIEIINNLLIRKLSKPIEMTNNINKIITTNIVKITKEISNLAIKITKGNIQELKIRVRMKTKIHQNNKNIHNKIIPT